MQKQSPKKMSPFDLILYMQRIKKQRAKRKEAESA